MAALLITSMFPSIALASSLSGKRDEARKVKAAILANQRALDVATAEHNRAFDGAEILGVKMAQTSRRLEVTEKDLQQAQSVLNSRLADFYKLGDMGMLEVVLGASDFNELLVRIDFVTRIARHDAQTVKSVSELRSKLSRQKQSLTAAKKKQDALVKRARETKGEIERRLRAQAAQYKNLQATIARLQQEASRRRIVVSRGGTRILRINGFVFPVAGPHSFSNDFGNPRSGGRSHKGIDIFALRGTPTVAAVSGTIFNAHSYESGLGGITLWIRGNDGRTYYYAHLSRLAVGNGARVSAGQVVGYVGDTGNARGGSPHLHFEIHEGGRAINPYPILRAADG